MLITLDLIKTCAAQIKKRRQETLEEFMKRLTHLHLNSKHISKISALEDCVNLEVLYLYDNEITHIENLSTLSKLTHLYLQDNSISKISNLDHVSTLQKISLDRNCITLVEGLSSLVNLEELHVSAQRPFSASPLSAENQLLFDSLSLTTLSRTLTSLHCASNNMSDLSEIAKLSNLTYLDLSQNNISDFEALAILFSGCRRLQKLMLKGNPISKKREYKDTIIIMSSPALGLLDDKEITSNERIFLEKKAARKSVPTDQPTSNINSTVLRPHGSPTVSRNESRVNSPKSIVPKLHGSGIGK